MNDQDKHKWKELPVPQGDNKYTKSIHVCTRCKCYRFISNYRDVQYEREKQMYGNTRPDCFGDIPINEQTID